VTNNLSPLIARTNDTTQMPLGPFVEFLKPFLFAVTGCDFLEAQPALVLSFSHS
jgi:hypothetical protein